MLKTSSIKSAKPKKDRVEFGDDKRARCYGGKLDDNEFDGSKIEDDEIGKKGQETSKSKNLSKSKKMVKSDFFTSKLG